MCIIAAAFSGEAVSNCSNASCADLGTLFLQTWTRKRSSLSADVGLRSSRPYCGVAVNTGGCGEAVEQLGESFASMCMGYGGPHDMCTLNINNDKNFGISKNPEDCHGKYLFLWDEPQTQGKNTIWAATQWKAHVAKWSSQLLAARARGLRVTSPAFTDYGGPARQKMQAFFGACSECNDPDSVYYVDVLAMNQWLLHDAVEHSGQEVWIKEETAAISRANGNRPVVLMNFAWLGAKTADAQAQVIANSRIFDPSWSGLDAVFYFAAKDYGGGTQNNFLDSVTSGGSTIAQVLLQRCGEASVGSTTATTTKTTTTTTTTTTVPSIHETPGMPACDANCRRHGHGASCRNRVRWVLQQPLAEGLDQALERVNAECTGQCHCAASAFAGSLTQLAA